jgi:uncharacterized protein (DUF1800 family)
MTKRGQRVGRWLVAMLLGGGLWLPTPYPADAGPSRADVVRFLEQTTFGPTPELIAHVLEVGLEGFLEEQFGQPAPSYPDLGAWPDPAPMTCDAICLRDNYSVYPLQRRFFQNALTGPDQLRQRVAFALSQIFVVSAQDGNLRLPSRMLPYLEVLDRNAFGNFRQLMRDITLNPAMGRYLDMVGNNRTAPNENYARELLQLFTVGVDLLSLDGLPLSDWFGNRLSTYDQDAVTAFARVFTGWVFAPPTTAGVVNYAQPMVPGSPNAHDTGAKTLMDGVILPAGHSAATDLEDGLDNIFMHPNVGPFVSRNLIQHLVTSNPSGPYVERVATVFRQTGGDLKAVVRAIVLDPEARDDPAAQPTYGHLREPVLWITSLLRAFGVTGATTDFVLGDSFLPGDVRLNEDLFRPPSVFSFFPPGYVIAGEGIKGPEFALQSTTTAIARTNFAYDVIYKRMPTSPDRPMGTWLDLSPLTPLAAEPGQLVDTLDQLLLHGSMTTEVRDVVRTSVSSLPASDALGRVRNAVYLIVTSPQYLVER